MKFEIIDNINPSNLVIDPDNIRGHYNVDGLAKEISQYGLLHPPTVVKDKEGKYHVWDGHRRILACQQLEKGYKIKTDGKTITYEMPKNFRVQLVKNVLWEDVDILEKIQVRISATDSVESFTSISLGTALIDWTTRYAKIHFDMEHDVAKNLKPVWSQIEDAMMMAFPSKTLRSMKEAIRNVSKLGSVKIKNKMHEAVKSGIVTEELIANVSRTPKEFQEQAIDKSIEYVKKGYTGNQISRTLIATKKELEDSKGDYNKVFDRKLTEMSQFTTFHLTTVPIWLAKNIRRRARAEGKTIAEVVVPVLTRDIEIYLSKYERAPKPEIKDSNQIIDVNEGQLEPIVEILKKEDRLAREASKDR